MNYHFKIHQQVRHNLRKILTSTSLDGLLTIPNGFNNNIFWNVAHCLATQQLLHYYLSDNDFRINAEWVEKYKKNTVANFDATEEDVENLSHLLMETPKILVKDYQQGLFQHYTPYTTSLGIVLENIEEAIMFNNTHENLHLGYIMAQKKTLGI